jgi:hypothetical protein
MFKRKKTAVDEPVLGWDEAPVVPPAPAETVEDARTTCYPQDGQPPPPVAGQPRTTVYRQAVRWNRGGYDTIN